MRSAAVWCKFTPQDQRGIISNAPHGSVRRRLAAVHIQRRQQLHSCSGFRCPCTACSRYEVEKLTASQRLDLNLEKGRMRDELQVRSCTPFFRKLA